MDSTAISPYVWLVCNDLSPNRATVVAATRPTRTDAIELGARIWRAS